MKLSDMSLMKMVRVPFYSLTDVAQTISYKQCPQLFNDFCFLCFQVTKILTRYVLLCSASYRLSHYYLINCSCYHLFQVNQIRDSLAIMGDNSTAFSLPQVRNLYVFAYFPAFFQKKIQNMETLIKTAIFMHENLWLSLNVFTELRANK